MIFSDPLSLIFSLFEKKNHLNKYLLIIATLSTKKYMKNYVVGVATSQTIKQLIIRDCKGMSVCFIGWLTHGNR